MSGKNLIWDTPCNCKGKENTDKSSWDGVFYGWIKIEGRKWAIVKWEGDEDPDLYKANLLLIEENRMIPLE